MADTTNEGMPVFLRRTGLMPAARLQATRDAAGLERTLTVFGQPAWLVSRAEDVRTVLGDPTVFTTSGSLPASSSQDPDEGGMPGNLLFMHPPQHTMLRRMLTPAFTAQSLRRLEPRIREIVDDRLRAMAAAGPPADLVAAFSWEIPSQVICELLGIPPKDRARFRSLIDPSFDFGIAEEERRRARRGLTEYMHALVAQARATPDDDLFGVLVREHADVLSQDDFAGIGVTLMQAGHETTASMIASSVLALLTHPDQLELFRNEPRLTRNAIEELLRYLAVVQIIPPRRASRDTIVGGQRVAAGDLLVVSLPAASHDPDLVAEPDLLDITRSAPSHIAFGHGIHHCLGAPLARLEMTIALPALFRRFPDLALAVKPEDVSYKTGTVVHGVKALPVTW